VPWSATSDVGRGRARSEPLHPSNRVISGTRARRLLHRQRDATHRAVEFKKFLSLIDKSVPAGLDVHVVIDNASTHKTPAIQKWFLAHPRFHVHFTPTSSSWINLVERWFSEITEKWIRRGTHRSVKELAQSITDWIDSWNENPRPYVWHKTADEILDSLAGYLQRIGDSEH
jgi:transposase